jgi:hypothetical protein
MYKRFSAGGAISLRRTFACPTDPFTFGST